MTLVSSHSSSVLVCAVVSVSIVVCQIVFKGLLASTPALTIATGFINSLLFVCLLTGLSNLEMSLFGSSFQSRLGEVMLCLFFSCGTASLVHRVSVTTCFLFSLLALYYVSRLSSKYYGALVHQSSVVYTSNKKRR